MVIPSVCASNVCTQHASPVAPNFRLSHSFTARSADPVRIACSSKKHQSTQCKSSACAAATLCAGPFPARPSQKMSERSHATLHS